MTKLKSFFEKLFLGETLVEKVNSPINGEIKIYDGWFGKSVRVSGITQSGELVEKLWKIGLKAVSYQLSAVSNCLILGLGCGDAAKLVSKKWPKAKITGVEIDPMVVEVGKKYFGLGEIKNLEIVFGDAISKVKSQKSKVKTTIQNSKFDLILVDLYLGKEFPKKAESEEFIKGVKDLLNKTGLAIFNRLSYSELSDGAVKFAERLRDYFPKVWTKKAVTNLLIYCCN